MILVLLLAKQALNCLLKWVASTHSLAITKEELFFGESNDVISQKIAASSRNNLTPIVCIGELSTEEKSAQAEVKTQIRSAVKDQKNLKKLVIAYEPTWAIGVEHPASAEHINTMCALIRTELEDMKIENFQILYGG